MEAMKEVLMRQFVDDAQLNFSNEILGQMTRARLEGLQKVEEGFKEIEKYRTIKEKDIEQKHPGR